MSRFHMRRGRILPGPLRALSPVERSPVPVTALALTSAAAAALLLLLPQFGPGVSVDPTPMVEYASAASAEPEARVHAASDPLVSAPPASPEAIVLTDTQPVAALHSEPVQPQQAAKSTVVRSAAAEPVGSAIDPQLFKLDLLPTLEADGADLDITPAGAPLRVATKPASRKTAAAGR